MKTHEANVEMLVEEHIDLKKEHHETISDNELIRRFRMGDENAFSAIVIRYQGRLLRVAKTILGDENEAMDISQETFVKAYFNLENFREDSSLYTWLYRILYNLCISSLRRKKIISFLSFDVHNDSPNFISKMPDPGEEYEQREIMAAVNEALNKLPLRQRTVFIMKQIDGLKYEEIAQVMGISEGAAKASYFHAVQKLKKLLISYGEDYGLR